MVTTAESRRDYVLQMRLIVEIPYYDNLFTAPFPNNYSIVLLNKLYDKERVIYDKSESLQNLNDACFGLNEFCQTLIKKDVKCQNEYDYKLLYKTNLILHDWKKNYLNRQSFLVFDHINFVSAALKHFKIFIPEEFKKKENIPIKERIINIPYCDKAFFKIGIYIPYDQVYSYLNMLLPALSDEPGVFGLIESIEIAKEIFPASVLATKSAAVNFSTINFFPDKQKVKTIDEAMTICRLLTNNMQKTGNTEIDEKYVHRVADNISLSQGYRNYKKILFDLDALADVYTRDSNYAFLC
jgi:hypothetical protein